MPHSRRTGKEIRERNLLPDSKQPPILLGGCFFIVFKIAVFGKIFKREKLFCEWADFSFLEMVFRGDDVGLLSNHLNHGVYGKEN